MVKQLHTPVSSPQPPPWPNLSAEINAATRAQHSRLNRMIIERLPEALPPKTTHLGLFGSGLLAFADIFLVFESCWDAFVSVDEAPRSEHDRMIHSLLSDLRPEGLDRTRRLCNDMQHISDLTSISLKPIAEIRERCILNKVGYSIETKPHVLLAYGWVMYMAIFSGGRHIRKELSKAGPTFWMGKLDVTDSGTNLKDTLEMPGFSFLSFDDDEDGEEIKNEFKARFAQADMVLNQQERQDVIQAAQGLFDDCIAIVDILDKDMRRRNLERFVPYILNGVVGAAILLFYVWLSFF